MQVLDNPGIDVLAEEEYTSMASKPTPTERLKAVDTRLEAIEQSLGIQPPRPKASSIGRLWNAVTEHKGTSLIVAVLTCLSGIFGTYYLDHRDQWFNDAVDRQLDKSLKTPGGISETLGKVKATTEETNSSLNTLRPFIQDLVRHEFESASNLPPHALAERLPAVNDLLSVAKNQAASINPQVVEKLGNNLVKASYQYPETWSTAVAALDYKSFINHASPLIPVYNSPRPGTHYAIAFPPGKAMPNFHTVGNAPKDESAMYDQIGRDENWDQSVSARYIFGDGGNVTLDGMQLKNVVFRNVHIYYTGGSVQMTNVYFVDCTFELVQTKNAQNLALAALSVNPSTTFKAG